MADRDPYGRVGDLQQNRASTNDGAMPEWLRALPEWLRNQYQFYRNDEAGDAAWSIGQGNLRAADGREVYQVGDENAWRRQLGSNQDSGLIDPSAVQYDEDLGWVTSPENVHQDQYNWWKEGFPMLAAVIGAGMFGPSLGLGEAAGGGGAFAGSTAGGSLEGLAGLGEAAGAGVAGAGGAAGGGAAAGGGGAFAGSTAGGSLGSSAASGLGGFLRNNAGALIRGGLGLAGLGASRGGGGGGGGGGGDMSNPAAIIEAMANANRVDHTTPLGSRRWSRGNDGRWSVNDTMDPTEEANFRNVQGLNSGVTDMARQRLAALLSQPRRPRADMPLPGFGG